MLRAGAAAGVHCNFRQSAYGGCIKSPVRSARHRFSRRPRPRFPPPDRCLIRPAPRRPRGHFSLKDSSMPAGTVKWFNTVKGFGFIQPDDGSADVFVHVSAVERSGIGNLREGQKLTFDTERSPKNGKVAATNLRSA